MNKTSICLFFFIELSENELYHPLMKTTIERNIFGVYKKTGELRDMYFKDVIILNELQDQLPLTAE